MSLKFGRLFIFSKQLPYLCHATKKTISTVFPKKVLASGRSSLSVETTKLNFYSQNASISVTIADYEEVKSLPKYPEKVLIDVREPSELASTGEIPGSINIPLSDVNDALNLKDDQFRNKYGQKKPSVDTEIIFTCKSGKRAGRAAEAALALGYKSVKNYKGSWDEWAEKENLVK